MMHLDRYRKTWWGRMVKSPLGTWTPIFDLEAATHRRVEEALRSQEEWHMESEHLILDKLASAQGELAAVNTLLADAQEKNLRLTKILTQASRCAGKTLRGDECDEEMVTRVTELIVREEHNHSWLTTEERTAAAMDLAYANDRIAALEKAMRSFGTPAEGS